MEVKQVKNTTIGKLEKVQNEVNLLSNRFEIDTMMQSIYSLIPQPISELKVDTKNPEENFSLVKNVSLNLLKSRLFIIGSHNHIKILDLKSGKMEYIDKTVVATLSKLHFSGNMLAFASNDLLKIQTIKQKQIFELKGHTKNITDFQFSLRGNHIFSSSQDATIRMWDIFDQDCIMVYNGYKTAINKISISQSEKLLFSGDEKGSVCFWQISNGRLLKALQAHTGAVKEMIAGRNFLVTAGDDRLVKIYGIKEKKCIKTFKNPAHVSSIDFSSDECHVIIGNMDGSITVQDIKNSNIKYTVSEHTEQINSLNLSKDRSLLVAGSNDCSISFYDFNSGSLLGRFYNLAKNLIWISPKDDIANLGWIYTDRPDLIDIIKYVKGSNKIEKWTMQEKNNYFFMYHNPEIVIARLDADKYKNMINKIKYDNLASELATHIETQKKIKLLG